MRLIMEENTGGEHRRRLTNLLGSSRGRLRIASPYVTDRAAILGADKRDVQLITSLTAMDVVAGATSLDCLGALIEAGVRCKSLSSRPKLHAKVYIFGSEAAIVTSANLTASALDRNIEVGVELRGMHVTELIAWFEKLWRSGGRVVDAAMLADLRQQTNQMRREFAALRKKANTVLAVEAPRASNETSRDSIGALFAASRTFICNTNRRNPIRTASGGFFFEEQMRNRGYAAAWNGFKFEQHIQQVRSGDAIFMFAKGVGIIAVGRANGALETLAPGKPGRLYDEPYVEWRVPVDWLEWREPEDALPLGDASYNFSFWDISAASYADLRQRIKQHFTR